MTLLLKTPLDKLPTARLTIALLGPLQITLDGQPLAFAYDKVPALLVYLAVESDRAHRRAALADLLWPDQNEAAARHNLSQALFNLRRSVGADAANPLLLTTRDTVRLNPHRQVWVDVAAFHQLLHGPASPQRLQQANALYRGEFLEGWGIDDSASFEEWMLLTREQLRGHACDVLRQLTEAHTLSTRAEVCDYARRWIALDPLCEDAHRRLMRALAESGQRTSALAQFEQCRRILQAELGIEPEPATIALYEELRQHGASAPPRPMTPVRSVLPLASTRLVDRERELTALAVLLADPVNRLITITGPGGVGKTRLALHAASANTSFFADGVYFVPLAPIREPAQVLSAIAQALGVQQNDPRPLKQLVGAALASRHLLLVLDNCEHLLPDTAALVGELLAAAPLPVVLATSRTALRLSYEHRYQVAPLSLECQDQTADGTQVHGGAITLFIERAQAARPSVELDYCAITAICRRLDGLPLAIELAAGRSRLLNPRELLARLEQRQPLLSGGPHDLPERHQTMYATIDWSYQLLNARQQALLRRLAVFVGGWTVAAAEAVCADLPGKGPQSASVLDDLAALLDASLIQEVPNSASEPRCTMLETIREYAQAQLVAHNEWQQVQALHARYLAELAAVAFREFSSPNQLAWLQRWEEELDNLRAVLGWCSEHAVGLGLRLASDLHRFWDIRGYRREGRDWLEVLLERPAQPSTVAPTIKERAYGLLIAGAAATFLSDFAKATKRLHESLALHQQLEDQRNIARILNSLGSVALHQGDYPAAERHYRESLLLRRELHHTVGMASTLNNLGLVTRLQGDLHTARIYYDESLTLYRQIGDQAATAFVMGHIAAILLQQRKYAEAEQVYQTSHTIAHELGNKPGLWITLNGLGDVARMQQRYREAKDYYRQSLMLATEIHAVESVAHDLFCLAAIAWAEQQAQHAALLLGATAALNRSAQLTHEPADMAAFEQHLAAVRAALDAPTFEAAWGRGQRLSLEQAVALALHKSV